MAIQLRPERRREMQDHLQNLFERDFDEPLSDFRANAVLDLFMKTVGPSIYNQAVRDVRTHLQKKLDDLDGEVYVDVEI